MKTMGKLEHQNPEDRNNQNMARQTPISKQYSANQPIITQRRVLGSGRNKLEVSALGFGCMGNLINLRNTRT